MGNGAKKFSPAIFGIVIICFFLPFINISCSGQKIATLSGIQLVSGTTMEGRKINPEPWAVVAFISSIAGLGLSFMKSRKSSILAAVSGAIGVISLLLLKAKIDNDMLKKGKGVIQVEYDLGFWLTFLLFLSAIGLNWFLFTKDKPEASSSHDVTEQT